MRKLFSFFLLLLCSSPTWAKQLTQEQALDVAQNFFDKEGGLKSSTDIKLVAVSSELTENNSLRSSDEAFYVFNNNNNSFVIVSADDRMKPILGYSLNSPFHTENIPSNIQNFLSAYYLYYNNLDNSTNILSSTKSSSSSSFATEVSPLLGEINWDQSSPYNNMCPVIDGKTSVTGCVATAMAMILKYHEYPTKGTGSHSYTTESGTKYSLDFQSITFDWKNMLPQYSKVEYNETQAKAVAELMYACGVGVEMDYSPLESGAYSSNVPKALINFFGYNKNLGYVSRNYFNTSEWMEMLKTELNSKRPVFYSGSSSEVGHAFVIDGYDKDDMVHVNWGWDGYNNGYFDISSLDPTSTGIGGGSGNGGGFTNYQSMVIGIQPETVSDFYFSFFALEEMEIDKKSVAKNESFNITLTNLFNLTSVFNKGFISVILENQAGEKHVLYEESIDEAIETNYGFSKIDFTDIKIPSEAEDGNYKLYIATKDVREKDYSKVRGNVGSVIEYNVSVKNDVCTLTPFSGNLDLKNIHGELEATTSLYSGMTGKFKLSLSNSDNDSEYYGMGGILLLSNDATPQLLSVLTQTQFLIPANTENQEINLNAKMEMDFRKSDSKVDIPTGNYYIAPFVSYRNTLCLIGELIPVVIKEGKICDNIKLSNLSLEKSIVGVNEDLTINADITLDGEGNIFNENIYAAVFSESESSSQNIHQTEVFIEKENQPYKFTMTLNPMVETGKYFVALFRIIDNKYTQISNGLPFTVSENPTGLETIATNTDGIKIVSVNSNSVNIILPEQTESIDIYNISGNRIYNKNLTSENMSANQTLETGYINDGIYIISVRTKDGKTVTTKFIKR